MDHQLPFAETTETASPVSAAKPKETKEQRIAREREELETRLAQGDLDDVRTKVAYVLNRHPQCRNNDIELAIRYWKLFHRDDVGNESVSYEALRNITRMTSIVRARATIQNQFGLFVSEDTVAAMRSENERSVRKHQRRAARQTTPFVHVFADESGKTDSNYVIGSLWVNDCDEQMYNLGVKLVNWRKTLASTSELHFADIRAQKKADYLAFVRESLTVSDYVGFKAITLARSDVRQRPTDEAIFQLYFRMIVDGVRHELDRGRFTLPRNIVLHKDADDGADKLRLLELRDRLRSECLKQFDNQVYVAEVLSVDSRKDILMQLADVFTGSVNRLVNRLDEAPRNHKDEVAEGVFAMLNATWRDLEHSVESDFLELIRL